MMDIEKEKIKFEDLGAVLKNIPKPKLAEDRKSLVKTRVFSRMERPAADYVRSISSNFGLDAYRKAMIKERIFELIEQRVQKSYFFSNFFAFHKKLISAVLTICITFSMFLFLNVDTNIVMAETFTTLNSFSGAVFLNREGEFIDVYEGMRIYERDRIVTEVDGQASIKYFDDSISRLSGNTEIVINKLFKPRESNVESYVEVSVVSGSLWSRVLNLVDEKSSFVVQVMDAYASTKKAAFNVGITSEGDAKIDVYKNAVEVKTSKGVETVVSGNKALLVYDKDIEVKEIEDFERDVAWVQDNLTNDEAYLDEVEYRLFTAKMESIGLENEENVDLGNSLREDAFLFLTFDDVKKKKVELDLAEKSFIQAEIKLKDENLSYKDREAAEKILIAFVDVVVDYYKFVDGVSYTDEEYAGELAGYAKDKILTNKKALNLILPDAPNYKAKEVIGNLEILSVGDDKEKAKIKIQQGLEKLMEAEAILEKGDVELAGQIVSNYKKEVSVIIETIDSLGEEDEALKTELIDKVVNGLKFMNNMDEVVFDDDINELVSVFDRDDVKANVFERVFKKEIPKKKEVIVENNSTGAIIPEALKEEQIPEETYGIVIEGDKPLSPLLIP